MAVNTKTANGGDRGFEAELFKAADKLRGNLEPSEYKHVALGLIFLKYISEAFEAQHAKLQLWSAAARSIGCAGRGLIRLPALRPCLDNLKMDGGSLHQRICRSKRRGATARARWSSKRKSERRPAVRRWSMS